LTDLKFINSFPNLGNCATKLVADDNRSLFASVRVGSGRNKVCPFEIFVDICGFAQKLNSWSET
jgi:hypothetical protein